MVQIGETEAGVPKGGERHPSYHLVPVQTDRQEAVERARTPKMFDDGEHMLDSLFEIQLSPSHAPNHGDPNTMALDIFWLKPHFVSDAFTARDCMCVHWASEREVALSG